MEQEGLKLNLGCGQTKIDGFLNIDNNPNAKSIDIKHNLNKFPYPFSDNSVDEIVISHVLEHLSDPITVFIELYRICEDGAIIHMKTPHFSCNWLHPGHKSVVSTMFFNFFDPNNDDYYGTCSFEVLKKELHWLRTGNKQSLTLNLFSKIISFFANLRIGFCERVWCYWVGGFEEIEFDIKVIKKNM